MNLSPSVAQLQREHVVMELECIDRMYLNAYIPKLTSEAGIGLNPGDEVQWELLDRGELHLVRLSSPPPMAKRRASEN